MIKACDSGAIEIGGIDLTRAADAVRAIGAAHERLGGLDVLINIAGMIRWQTVAEGDAETWDLLYAINVKTAVNCARRHSCICPATPSADASST